MGKPVFRKFYRYQIQGPNAQDVIKKLTAARSGHQVLQHGHITIAGRKVRALRHGMAGAPGLEVWGPYAEGDEIRTAILEAGKDVGIVPGWRARLCHQHARVRLDPLAGAGGLYRRQDEALPASGCRARATKPMPRSAAASSPTISRTTTRRRTNSATTASPSSTTTSSARKRCKRCRARSHRKKVTFAWNDDDVNKVLASMFAPEGENYKFIDLPLSNYASSSFDAVMKGGKVVGASMFSGYSFNERKMLSLGFVEEQYAKPGTAADAGVGRGERRHQEDHRRAPQADRDAGRSRARRPTPRRRRETYHQGWRTAAARLIRIARACSAHLVGCRCRALGSTLAFPGSCVSAVGCEPSCRIAGVAGGLQNAAE